MNQIINYLDRIDKTIYENVFVYANPPWLSNTAHFLVKSWLLVPLLAVFFVFYIRNKKENIFYILILTLLLLGLSESTASFFKELAGRHRPVYQLGIYIFEGAWSFPSAHALNTMAFAAFWAGRFKEALPYLYTASLVVGVSRMLANFHFPGDIIGGWIMGFIVGKGFYYLVVMAENQFEVFRSNKSGNKPA